MELHQLKCFLAVLEEGGFNRATARLHISQPALSYQIKQLEQELGMLLFHRRPGGVSPTEAGRILTRHARDVMDAVRKAHHAMEELSEGVVGEIRIGTANSVGIYFLPQVLWRMREKYPRAHPSVVYRQANELIDLLLEHRLDIVLVANPRQDRRLQQETVVEERVSLVCGRPHPFFGRRELNPKELQGLQFILLSTNNPTGQLIQDYLAQLKVNVEPMIYTDNTETVKKMVEVGLGVAFLPDMVTASDVVCDEEPSGKLSRIDIGPPLIRTIDMVTWKNSEMNRAMNAFIDELKKHAANWKGCTESTVS